MNPAITFLYGLLLLVLFGWYFFTDSEWVKRNLGTLLTVLLTAFCLWAVVPPIDVKDSDGRVLKPGRIHLGLDLQGGTSFLIRLEPAVNEKGERREITKDMVEQAMEAIRKRVDQFGVSEPIITPQGTDRILVQIPGLDQEQIKDARAQLQKVAKLEFKLVHPDSNRLVAQIEAGQEVLPIGYSIETTNYEREGKPVEHKLLVRKKADLLGDTVTRAGAFYDTRGWGVHLNFNSVGGAKFGDLTKQVFEEHSQMAIVLDGKVISAPGVEKGPIYGNSAEISGGNMSEKESRSLASALQNPLQTPVVIEEERSASSTLGTDAIRSGVYAGLGGLAAVLVFVLVYYRFAGLIAIVGLVVNIIVLFGAMSMFGFVLTLPGIAGVILTIGLAVDANVLIYERLREEMDSGKSLRAAVDAAYEKAFSVIFDANATTLITAAILFWQASGPIKGFAVTLIVGIIASVFSAMVVTRMLFSWALNLGFLKRISMLHLISGEGINFMGRRFLWIGISLTVIAISIVGFVIRGEKNFGIDFKGGDLLMLKSAKSVEVADVRAHLDELKLTDVVIQKESEPATGTEYISIRSPIDTSEKIEAQLEKTMPEAGFTQHKKDKVGKIVGGELAKSSMLALGLGMLGIFLYVTARFEMSFAIGALVALLHDVIITVGLFAIFGRELSLIMVGAILTIAGYSINDTIVVYDRIREGLKSGRRGSVEKVMNASINETLSRTLLTSGTTLLSVASLFIFGGPVLHDFAFAILIGIVVGTYSSIFIASPIVLWWSGKGGHDLRAEVKRAETPKPATA
ncbi:MAG: SecD/SecF fusion protein [Chthoniobacter sp.]|jgi:SecD/SecF fusion protein|nr:SecD/SecF fusion protein [Chthoniobacter sp.]